MTLLAIALVILTLICGLGGSILEKIKRGATRAGRFGTGCSFG